MGNQPGKDNLTQHPEELAEALSDISQRSQKLITDFIAKQTASSELPSLDPLNLGEAFFQLSLKMFNNPVKMFNAQLSLWEDYSNLWQTSTQRWLGQSKVDPIIEPEKGDRRFQDESWQNVQVFDFIKQSYLITSQWMQNLVHDVEGLDEKTARKVEFYTKQYIDAISPSNFVMTNPEVLRTTIESRGENLIHGLQHLLEDMEKGKGIRMTDFDAFTVGENIASSPGKVVFRNDLMELIQYSPTTEKVSKTPLLIIPPWINKFYILDLRPSNSFIKWSCDQGHTVFIISWVNPDEKLMNKGFEDYMLEGPLAAFDAIEKATGENKINAIGYCIGGTLLNSTLAYMAAKKDNRVKSATFFTTLTDFTDAGDLSIFIDDKQIDSLDARMEKTGLLNGSDMATTFNMLRSNDLIWSFVVNNYLLGKEPFPFDLLYWNSDSTRMPKTMHSFYLHKMYMENKLVEPGGIELNGVPIDLRKIKTPIYMVSPKEDHIAPWKATYAATQLYSGPVHFVQSGSGHIAGIVNPPSINKYGYWTNDEIAPTPEEWESKAEHHEGSWWPEWQSWIKKYAGAKTTKARIPGEGGLKAIEDAPGSYIKIKS
ncbi:MAG: class I poly(R)-hydroxyalkanoic acid synthase [Rhodospirillales bacterium]|nr:class I poly(R)-hydroxyalkanoic acid synthase [Rhodospirillales bacterium]